MCFEVKKVGVAFRSPSLVERQPMMNACESVNDSSDDTWAAQQTACSTAWVQCARSSTACSAARSCKVSE